MSLAKLFKMQNELDTHINKEKGLEGQNLLDKKILALQVELGELANEWRGFKFWSKRQYPRTRATRYPSMMEEDKEYYNPLLEEYVDCLHFILSIGLEIGQKEVCFEDAAPLENEFKNELEAFRHCFNWTVNLDYILFEEKFKSDYRIERTYFNLLLVFITLGEMLGFTWDQIEQAYINKNEINHKRQETGY